MPASGQFPNFKKVMPHLQKLTRGMLIVRVFRTTHTVFLIVSVNPLPS